MQDIDKKCLETTRHIADKILMLRRANKLTQEAFAEQTSLDRRTIARAEDGVHRPSAQTIEMIAQTFNIPVSYFFDGSVYRKDIGKTALIYEISNKLNILSKNELKKIKIFIDTIL